MDITAIQVWLTYIGYKIEECLTNIFKDNGRRHYDEAGKL